MLNNVKFNVVQVEKNNTENTVLVMAGSLSASSEAESDLGDTVDNNLKFKQLIKLNFPKSSNMTDVIIPYNQQEK